MPELVFEAVIPTTQTFGSCKSSTVNFVYRLRCANICKVKIQSREGVSVWDGERPRQPITQRHTFSKGEKVKVKLMFRRAPVPFNPYQLEQFPQNVLEAVLMHVTTH